MELSFWFTSELSLSSKSRKIVELAQFRSLSVLSPTLYASLEAAFKRTHFILHAGFPVEAVDDVSEKGEIREMRHHPSKYSVFRRNS